MSTFRLVSFSTSRSTGGLLIVEFRVEKKRRENGINYSYVYLKQLKIRVKVVGE